MNVLLQTLITLFRALRAGGFQIGIGELLEGLRIAEAVETEMQFRSLKNKLRFLWSVNTDSHAEEVFESAWISQVETKIEVLLAALRNTSPPQVTPVIEPREAFPIQQPIEIAEALPSNPAGFSLVEDSTDIKPPVNLIAPVDQASADNGWHSTVDKNGRGRRDTGTRPRSPGQQRQGRSSGRFPSRRYKFRVATDTPEPLRPVGVAPTAIPPNLRVGQPEAIFAYAPVSRLSMTYGWQYLRRPVPDGPANVLDIDATIAQVTHQGFFFRPVYRRWQSNHAHLLFLIDQGGSMRPFHDIAHDLVETAREQSSIKQVDVFYFHDVFEDSFYEDEHLHHWKHVAEAMENCTVNTSILIVSDAGAARGFKDDERAAVTLRMLLRLHENTNLIAWLNPVPRDRWTGSSADMIAAEIQMFQLDTDGFSNAVDVLQGRGVVS